MSKMLQIASKLVNYCHPTVMGILNVTPDSFAMHCASLDDAEILSQCRQLVDDGADIVDIGACSTRPGSVPVSAKAEWERLEKALQVVRSAYPSLPVSLDTFRADIAERAVSQFGINIINDVSGLADDAMLPLLARSRVPYILTHPSSACTHWTASTNAPHEVMAFFAHQLDRLHRNGVADVLLDPGFGFGKSTEQNYDLLRNLSVFRVLEHPIVVGLSRKSMIYQPLNTSPQDALIGTIAAHTLAAVQGADFIRVHDVAATRQTLRIVQLYQGKNNGNI